VTRLVLVLVLAGCSSSMPIADGGSTTPPVDAGSLGPSLLCRFSVIGAVTGTFDCQATATYARGSPNATTVRVMGNTRDRNPELDLTVTIPLEPEPGRTYRWADDVLGGEVLVTHQPSANAFAASKGQMVDPSAFSLRIDEVTGRVGTTNGGAQLRVALQLEATLRPTVGSPTTSNVRLSVSVTR